MTDGHIGRREFLLAGVAVTICTSGPAAGEAAVEGSTVQILMQDIAFIPDAIDAHIGDKIEWVNKDIVAHTATVDGEWEVELQPGESGTHVVTEEGVIDYYCRFHPNMTATITVTS